jgi:hypothetical protein
MTSAVVATTFTRVRTGIWISFAVVKRLLASASTYSISHHH